MFNQGGLSMEQAPPISVVLKFFITASIFGIFFGLSMLLSVTDIFEMPSNTFEVIVIHTLALGVMASFMLGALFQMLPVIAGVVMPKPKIKSILVHLFLVVGLLSQTIAFYTQLSIFYLSSALFLGLGLLYASTHMLKELIKIKDHSSSSKGMLLSLGSFTLIILLGLYLLLTLGGYTEGRYYMQLKEIHYSFALFGWLSLLIISISFQVVEMFYVTPKYPTFITKYLVLTIFILLVFKSIALFLSLPTIGINIFIVILFIMYAGITIHRLYRRRRPTSDATVWFWRLGMGLLILSMLSYIVVLVAPLYVGTGGDNGDSIFMNISYIAYIGFALSIVFAMSYKIVPFLVWFHLSNQGYMEAPMMHEVIHPKRAKIHFGIHIFMLIFWLISFFTGVEIIAIFASLFTIASFAWLFYHLIMALRKYSYTQKYTEKIEW